MHKGIRLLPAIFVFSFLAPSAVFAANALDSQAGKDLPIGAAGNTAIIVGAGQSVPAGSVEFIGKVGIGSASPATKLDVNGTTRTRTIELVDNVVSGAACAARNVGMDASGKLLSCQSGVWTGPVASPAYPNYINRVGSKFTTDIYLGNFTLCASLGHEHIGTGTYDVPVTARLWNSGSAWYAKVGSDGSENVYITAACWN